MKVVEKTKYFVEDVLKAGHNLEPLTCKFCGSDEVVFLQYVGDATCQDCGKWQTEQKTSDQN